MGSHFEASRVSSAGWFASFFLGLRRRIRHSKYERIPPLLNRRSNVPLNKRISGSFPLAFIRYMIIGSQDERALVVIVGCGFAS